jgi:chromosome segregation ATPase
MPNDPQQYESDMRHFRSEIDKIHTQIATDRREANQAFTDERNSWRSIAAELSKISGSLQVLLNDRLEFKETVARVFSRVDNTDKAVGDLITRVSVLEESTLTLAKNQDSTNNKLWSVVSVVLVLVITAVVMSVRK